MSSSAIDGEAPDLVCQLDNVQGIVDALTAVRWKRHQVSPFSFSLCVFNKRRVFLIQCQKSGRRGGIVGARRRFNRGGKQLSSGQSLSSA